MMQLRPSGISLLTLTGGSLLRRVFAGDRCGGEEGSPTSAVRPARRSRSRRRPGRGSASQPGRRGTGTRAPAHPTNVSVCGNGVAEPGEQCDGDDLRGLTCETAYRFFDDPNTQDCFGEPLACDEDCTFNSENTDACQCSCEEDFDCGFPDDPQGENRPIGIDCTTLWCPKRGCPCDHLADEDSYFECVDQNFEACEFFDDCLLDVGCFIGDAAFFYLFSTGAGICGEEQPGICDTDAASFQATDEILRQICTSADPSDSEFFRCESYCDQCDCSDPNDLGIYNPDEGQCS
jgi:hypothetical protein